MLHYTTLHYTYFSHYSDCCQKETKQCAHLRSKAAQLDESNMEFSLLKRLSQQYTPIIYGPLLLKMMSGMQLPVKVKALAMVHPGSSVLLESDSPCSSQVGRLAVCSVNTCWYDAMELSPLDWSAV